MAQYRALLQPLRIKGVIIPNRIMSTAHTSGASEDGKPKLRYQLYHEEKARGGIGLTMIGGSTAVAEDTPGADMMHLDASNDDIVPYYRELATRIHRYDTAVFAQIAHMGRRSNWDNQHWLAPISPSRVREPAHRSFPKQMEDWDFDRLLEAFARAAARVRKGGIDGVELSATHGHLLDQFWSPKSNRRSDHHGGSLENRLRFTLEILAAVRQSVGDDFVVGLRMSGDELVDGGLTPNECVEIARILAERGGVDYLSVLGASADDLPSHAMIFPGMDFPAGPYLQLASAIKRNVGIPVFHAQRMGNLATAARAIEEGHADMIGMTRAHLADPHIMRKLVEDRVDDIRPCIGANYCIDRLYSGGQAYCLHNPASGREQLIPHIVSPAPNRRRAVVVGAGPAGLEAARVLAERGHAVVLLERNDVAGGQVRLAARVAWRESLLMITGWLERQLRNKRVDCRYGCAATVALIQELEPDLVIIATGGVPDKGWIPGSELAATIPDVLQESVRPAERVLIFDDNGAEPAFSCAEFITERGSQVEFVSADRHPAPLLERTTRPTFMRHLYERGTLFTNDMRLTGVYREENKLICVLKNEYTLVEEEREVDQVIIDYGTKPVDALYFELKEQSINRGAWDYSALVNGRPQAIRYCDGGGFQLFRIGDAVASRNIHAALLDARRLCKDL
ncbi:FAD-dependent oxidoreductase [Bradyrhizobium prioriisuperbiae]|uniref:FAD-dependent oxidoreductase n=1 Tax=Bradyrhizobium prioriisuperbiae TaxID=2854389 RepID=UPI0028E3DF92|nr:FAD-dependent oxidoreductase [Bradyrhizobium prioritasuperba]